MSTILAILLIAVAVAYGIGALVCLRPAYRWCIAGYDYGGQNYFYNGSAACGFALIWPAFLYFRHHDSQPS